MSTTPQRLGKYELLERLGHGGVAEVWKALDIHLQRLVAIKLLHPNLRDDPSFITRFQREAQLIASLHHPNIVQIHGFEVYEPENQDHQGSSSIAYMVMEYIEGQTLADFIRETSSKGQIPTPVEIVNLFTSISRAIDYAHQRGMIHRDIKPANILLDRRSTNFNPMGEPILTDFGVARLLSTSSNTISATQLGTPLYISPEQARGYPGNERSDLYSLGIILYEIVTGVPPFRGITPHEVMLQHMNTTPVPPSQLNPNIPAALTLVILRSLSKDPGARFSSASALTAALAEALNVPIPDQLEHSTYPQDPLDMPTVHTFEPPPSQPEVIASSGGSSASAQPRSARSTGGQASTPGFTPIIVHPTPVPTTPRPQSDFPAAPPATPLPLPPSSSPNRSRQAQKWRRLYIASSILLLVALLGSLAAGVFLFFPQLLPYSSDIVGGAFYTSSGQIKLGTAQGIADELQIELQRVSTPATGKSYYLWLLPDRRPEPGADLTGVRPVHPPLLLTNNLPVQNGKINYFYTGDATEHNNLISTTSRLLITEEDANKTPDGPTTNHNQWRYYAEIPQAQIPGADEGFSALVHIRHLFYNETNIKVLGLPGGLDFWMLRNTEKVLEWSNSARDYWHGDETTAEDLSFMTNHFIRILNYLDGVQNMHVDAPVGTPILVDSTIAKVSLLTVDSQQGGANIAVNPPGYVDHVQLHVGQITKAPDATTEMRTHVAYILGAVNNAKSWLNNVHKLVAKLFALRNNPEALKQTSTRELLDEMVTQATYAYIGQLNPVTNQVLPGVLQAHYEIQKLAELKVTSKLPDKL